MKWHLVVVALAATVCIDAQAPPVAQPKPAVEAKPAMDNERTLERAQSMREQIGTGGAVKSHVRVSVRLKNGNKLRGVVKDGQLVERVDGLRFVDALAQETGAGIRLWYSSGARNYVFVPFVDFTEYQILQRLSQKQLEEIEQGMQMEESRRAEREAAAARAAAGKAKGAPAPVEPGEDATPAATQGEVAPTADTGKPADAGKDKDGKAKDGGQATGQNEPAALSAAEKERQRLWFSLLQEYPPTAGWGKSKRDEIARRGVVVGAKPSEKELRFVEQYEAWGKACEHFAVETEAKPAAEEAESAPADRRSKRKEK